ncbi:MAG: hypothetical protein AAGD32_11185 [Planctomycetota bacterium]
MRYLTDGSNDAPKFAPFFHTGTLDSLPANSTFPGVEGAELAALLKEHGYVGVQGFDDSFRADAQAGGLRTAGGMGRQSDPAAYDDLTREAKDSGHVCATLHVGNGLESDAEADRLLGAVVEASAKYEFPLYVETHRATVTQDVWRTVELVKRHPDLCINGDFSHWYTGLEMPYAGVDANMDYAQPVLDRVGYMHGRIGNSGSMQVDIGDGTSAAGQHVADFENIWGRCFAAFKRNAPAGAYLPLAPELLRGGDINYARVFDGREETDRWQQAGVMIRMAQRLFEAA